MRLGVVANLAPNSAAQAGWRQGDAIVSTTRLNELQDDPAKMMEMVSEREGQRLPPTYAPRGGEVEAWRWGSVCMKRGVVCTLKDDQPIETASKLTEQRDEQSARRLEAP